MSKNVKNIVETISIKCDQAIHSRDEKHITLCIKLISYGKTRCLKDYTGPEFDYFLGNLYAEKASVINENVSGWRTGAFPQNLIHSMNAYRESLSVAIAKRHPIRWEIETNIANALSRFCRTIEAIPLWSCNFAHIGDAPFVSSLAKARSMIWLRPYLRDSTHAKHYLYEAYLILSKLNDRVAEISHPKVKEILSNDTIIQKLFTHYGQSSNDAVPLDELIPEPAYSFEEKQYRRWCLNNRLFLNSLNDITIGWIADRDILQFPNHTVSIGVGPYLSAAFSAIKREYCFARFLAYEGQHEMHPDFENEQLFLTDTLDYITYKGHVEKTKTSLRLCFSIFDSLAKLCKEYFVPAHQGKVEFKPSKIKQMLGAIENPFIDALFWLSCDLTDVDGIKERGKWNAPNPDASNLRKIRNALEHNWLRVSNSKQSMWGGTSDYALVVSQNELMRQTIEALSLARSALIYFTFAVKSHEAARKTESDGKYVSVAVPIYDPEIDV